MATRVRIVAARPPRTSGSTTTIPLALPCVPFGDRPPHGRSGGAVTLWWPGGPLVPSGHGGRALWPLPTTGSGVAVG